MKKLHIENIRKELRGVRELKNINEKNFGYFLSESIFKLEIRGKDIIKIKYDNNFYQNIIKSLENYL